MYGFIGVSDGVRSMALLIAFKEIGFEALTVSKLDKLSSVSEQGPGAVYLEEASVPVVL